MTTPQAAMLFAAGFGTRMAPLTDTRPKPLIEVGGRTLLDHTLDLCHAAGLEHLVVNTHYKADQIQTHLQGQKVQISHETPQILETGGGLRHALPLLGPGPVYTLNTDAIWTGPNPLTALAQAWDGTRMEALLMCVPLDSARGHAGSGDFTRAENGRLSRPGPLIYGGIQIIKPDGLSEIDQTSFSLNVLWRDMAARGRLYGAVHSGAWCDVGQPESLSLAAEMLADV